MCIGYMYDMTEREIKKKEVHEIHEIHCCGWPDIIQQRDKVTNQMIPIVFVT